MQEHLGPAFASSSHTSVWLLVLIACAPSCTSREPTRPTDATAGADAAASSDSGMPDSRASDASPNDSRAASVGCVRYERLSVGTGEVAPALVWLAETLYDAGLVRLSRHQERPDGTPLSVSSFRTDGATEHEMLDSNADGVTDLTRVCGTTTVDALTNVTECDTDGNGEPDRRTQQRFAGPDMQRLVEMRFSVLVDGTFVEDLVRTLTYDDAGRVVGGESTRVPGGPGVSAEDTFTVEDRTPDYLAITIRSASGDGAILSEFAWDPTCYAPSTGPF
jgi:hypothetical protein